MDYFQYMAEQRISEAYSKGEFNNLSGYGKPVDIAGYFEVPAQERMAVHIMKNAGLIPYEVELRKEIYNVAQLIKKCIDKEDLDILKLKYTKLQDELILEKESKS